MTSVKRDVASKDGKREDGPYVRYYDNGQVQFKVTYKDGEPDGPYVGYHKNGQLSSKGKYKDGKQHGPWVMYHENGQVAFKGTYRAGKLDWKCRNLHFQSKSNTMSTTRLNGRD